MICDVLKPTSLTGSGKRVCSEKGVWSASIDYIACRQYQLKDAIENVGRTSTYIYALISPFYKGINLWNMLEKDVQNSDDIFIFKSHVSELYKVHKP